jgi:hypothetical protein
MKYCSIISVPLFSIIVLYILNKAKGFSFSKNTVSRSIMHLRGKYRLIFRLNFLLKALFDLGFALYLIDTLKISYFSPLAISMFLSALFFGLLSYYIEGQFTLVHNILIYGNIFLSSAAQVLLANITGVYWFMLFTYCVSFAVVSLSFGFLIARKTNAFVQIVCAILVYFWLIAYVFLI